MRILVLFLVVTGALCYKFLIYSPVFGYSHQKYLGIIADHLTEAGHHVTVLMPIQDPQLKEKTCVKHTKNIIFVDPDQHTLEAIESMKKDLYKMIWTMNPDPLTIISHGQNMSRLFEHSCSVMMQQSELIKQLKNENFDVGIAEPFAACGFGLFDVLGLNKTIAALSTRMEAFSKLVGEPLAPSYVPAITSTVGEKMNIWQRMKNLVDMELGAFFFRSIFNAEHAATKKIYPQVQPLKELFARTSLSFSNFNPYLNYPMPLLQRTIEIGGITVDLSRTKLDERFHQLLNERRHAIYISFGSVARSKDMPKSWKNSLVKVFENMQDVTFIWKYEEPTNITKHLKNVYLSKWLPQNALLADERLSLFVTHGGLGSTTEVAYHGKPAVLIPLFAEQPRNAHMLARHGGAIAFNKVNMENSNLIINTFKSMLENSSYTVNAQRLSEILKNKPISNIELLVKNCEFVAKYGPLSQLDSYGRHLSVCQYYYVDAAAILTGIVLVIIYILYRIASFIFIFMKTKQKRD